MSDIVVVPHTGARLRVNMNDDAARGGNLVPQPVFDHSSDCVSLSYCHIFRD